jgi:hypothetical protein
MASESADPIERGTGKGAALFLPELTEVAAVAWYRPGLLGYPEWINGGGK